MKREALIKNTAKIIAQIPATHPLRVAVDGVDAAGKTIFADELASALAFSQRQVIRASVDGFHNPKSTRRQKGSLSPAGFYRDSYDYQALIDNLLFPLSPDGERCYRTAVFDLQQDRPIQLPRQKAENDAILIFDGIFLLREILLPFWDLTIYLHADFINTIPRGVARDQGRFGSKAAAEDRYEQRYVPGQKLYLKEANPLDKADILIDNNILDDPEMIREIGRIKHSGHRKPKD